MLRAFLLIPCAILFFTYSNNVYAELSLNNNNKIKLKPFNLTIDWVPSPEYYGFFYAKENGYYKDVGLDVRINYGSGAPVVANQLAAGAVYAGTTTSDNVLRQVARGAYFYKVVPLLKFNPCVLASLSSHPIKSFNDLKNKVLGTNKQSSVYQQLLYLINIGELLEGDFKEYPIGYGGSMQLKNKLVDAILAYTTNVVIDLQTDGIDVYEIHFGEWIKTYGLVLVISEPEIFHKAGLSDIDISNFINATIKGYEKGCEDISKSIIALQKAEPTLNKIKLLKFRTSSGG